MRKTMGRKKKVKPIDIIKELGKLHGVDRIGEEFLSFVEEHLTKFNTIDKAQTLLWNMNITVPNIHPTLYRKVYDHLKNYNYKNPLTIKRLENFEAFLWDYGYLKPEEQNGTLISIHR